MQDFIKNYIKGCITCQQHNIDNHPNKPATMSATLSDTTIPFKHIMIDLIMDLPKINNYDSCLSVIDLFSKFVILIPCSKTISGNDVFNLLLSNIFNHFSFPKTILSDQDPHWHSSVKQQLFSSLGIKMKFTTAYHPQTNGVVEQMDWELGTYLCKYCSTLPQDWLHFIPLFEFSFNSLPHGEAQSILFKTLFGFILSYIPPLLDSTNAPKVNWTLWIIDEEKKRIKEILGKKEKKSNGRIEEYEKGDRVWLDGLNLEMKGFSKKLKPRRYGPFTVKKCLGPVNYKLKLPATWKIHSTFHVSKLHQYYETPQNGGSTKEPQLELVEGEEEFEIKVLINHWQKGKTM